MFGWESFHRVTVVGDGCYRVSTIGPAPLLPETMIFDERDGLSHYCEYHDTDADLSECHDDVVRRFANGEIVLDKFEEFEY